MCGGDMRSAAKGGSRCHDEIGQPGPILSIRDCRIEQPAVEKCSYAIYWLNAELLSLLPVYKKFIMAEIKLLLGF